jgi:hypothetical protein
MRTPRFAKFLTLTLLDVLQPPVPRRMARWVPRFMLASSGERASVDRLRRRLS